ASPSRMRPPGSLTGITRVLFPLPRPLSAPYFTLVPAIVKYGKPFVQSQLRRIRCRISRISRDTPLGIVKYGNATALALSRKERKDRNHSHPPSARQPYSVRKK